MTLALHIGDHACGVCLTEDRPCGECAVDVLVFCNPNITPLWVCVAHLAELESDHGWWP